MRCRAKGTKKARIEDGERARFAEGFRRPFRTDNSRTTNQTLRVWLMSVCPIGTNGGSKAGSASKFHVFHVFRHLGRDGDLRISGPVAVVFKMAFGMFAHAESDGDAIGAGTMEDGIGFIDPFDAVIQYLLVYTVEFRGPRGTGVDFATGLATIVVRTELE